MVRAAGRARLVDTKEVSDEVDPLARLDQSCAPLPRVLSGVGSIRPSSERSSGLLIVRRSAGNAPGTSAPRLSVSPGRESVISASVIASWTTRLTPASSSSSTLLWGGAAWDQVEQEAKRDADARAQQFTQQVAPQLDRLLERRVERVGDLWLQARLLVPADREVREQRQLGAAL